MNDTDQAFLVVERHALGCADCAPAWQALTIDAPMPFSVRYKATMGESVYQKNVESPRVRLCPTGIDLYDAYLFPRTQEDAA